MKLDDLIYDGIENTLDERLSQYTADLKKHHFSAAYKIRRHQTIRALSRDQKISGKFSVRRIRYVLLAVILAAFLLTGIRSEGLHSTHKGIIQLHIYAELPEIKLK